IELTVVVFYVDQSNAFMVEPAALIEGHYQQANRELEAGRLPPKSSLAYVASLVNSSTSDYTSAYHRSSSSTKSHNTDQQIYSSPPPYGSHSTVISIPSNGRPSMYSSYHGTTEFSHATENNAVNLRVYPEVTYNMQLASGSGESGYQGGFDNPSSSSNSTNPRTPSRFPYGHRRTPSNLSNASVGSANVNPSFESDV
ncbi:unnamed protein product, partial [Allacma fusca]